MSSSGQSAAQGTETTDSPNTKTELFGIGEIPDGWDKEPLTDRAEIIAGSSPPGSTYNNDGDGLPFFQGNAEFGALHPSEVKWCSEPQKIAEPRDILISIRAPVGDLNIANQKCCIGRGLAALRPDELNGLYLFYSLRKRKRWLSRLATGSTFKAITKGDLERLDVALPPLEEQRKIASVLYNIDLLLQKQESFIEELERLKWGLRQDLYLRGIDKSGRLRDPPGVAEELYVDSDIGPVPADWELIELSEIVHEDRPIVYGILKPGNGHPDGVPVIKVENIEDGQILQDDLLLTDPSIDEKYSRSRLWAGDLLFTIRGTVGRMAFVPEELEGANITQDTARISIDQADESYIRGFLKSWRARKYFERHTVGNAVNGINLGELRDLPVPLPSREEQERIGKVLSGVRERIEKERETHEEYDRTKRGLMQDLLSGEVRTYDKDIDVLPEVKQHG